MKTVLSKETFKFLSIAQDVLHIFVTNVVILVRRLLNFLTNDLIITGFVKKDIEERCQVFFETVEKRIKKIEEDNTSIFNSFETLMKNTEDRNITIRSKLDKLEDRINSCENFFLLNNPQRIN